MRFEWNRRDFLRAGALASLARPSAAQSATDAIVKGWENPGRTYRPRTRWWWPGNAVSKSGITWELEQMRTQGMGGVEIISSWGWYAKGDIPYLSDEWCEMIHHTMSEATRLDMDVALTFGPGWCFGGFWVPVEDRSKVLAASWQDVGAGTFDAQLATFRPPAGAPARNVEPFDWIAPDENKIIAVVAARLDRADSLVADSLTDLTDRMDGGHLKWTVPTGQWRIVNFRIKYTGQQNAAQNSAVKNWVVDHLNKGAMTRYCAYLGKAFRHAFGPYFGKTGDSFFCDSFEVMVPAGTLLWSTGALQDFRRLRGYDLTRYLPAIWFDIGEDTSRLRYDVNHALHEIGLDATFKTFIDEAAGCRVQARIQPHYRFTEEIIQGAGMTPRPETEVTTARFETIADPRKATAAGAHFYGRPILSAESYTFLHNERYRTSLEEMKRATDAFLRDGVTQFYNHGYLYSEEEDVAPSRDMPWANRISHWNTWWRYYHFLAAYIARAGYLCRQGSFAGDVLLYSPQAKIWSEKVLFGDERRVMPYGNVPKTLVANGYDYDPVNDDVLQNLARFENGCAKIRDLSFRFVVLPAISVIPLATLEALQKFVAAGGILIALDSLPRASVGMHDRRQQDDRLQQIVADLFGADGNGKSHAGGGRTYFMPAYKIVEPPFSPGERPPAPTPALIPPQSALLAAMGAHLAPDFMLEDGRQSDGLTFLHRRAGDIDIYFVTNLQPHPIRGNVTFRVKGRNPVCWNAMTGEHQAAAGWQAAKEGTMIPIDLDPWASVFFVFEPGNTKAPTAPAKPQAAPETLEIAGTWNLAMEGVRFPRLTKEVSSLASWTEDPATLHFSGTGTYQLEFDVPQSFVSGKPKIVLDLGSVGDVAEVHVNGKSAGVRWMQPYRLDVGPFLKPGRNRLSIAVTNQLMNHVSGLPSPPGVPAKLIPRYGETSDRYTGGLQPFKREQKFHPLPASGLMGPVRLLRYV